MLLLKSMFNILIFSSQFIHWICVLSIESSLWLYLPCYIISYDLVSMFVLVVWSLLSIGSSRPQLDYLAGVNNSWHVIGPAHKQRYLQYHGDAHGSSSGSSSRSSSSSGGSSSSSSSSGGDIGNNSSVGHDKKRLKTNGNSRKKSQQSSKNKNVNAIDIISSSMVVGNELHKIKERLFESPEFAKYLNIITSLHPIRLVMTKTLEINYDCNRCMTVTLHWQITLTLPWTFYC